MQPTEVKVRNGKKYIKCSKCSEYKELNENNFYKDNTSTGYKSICKECKKKYYIQNREKKLTYQNKYNKERKCI